MFRWPSRWGNRVVCRMRLVLQDAGRLSAFSARGLLVVCGSQAVVPVGVSLGMAVSDVRVGQDETPGGVFAGGICVVSTCYCVQVESVDPRWRRGNRNVPSCHLEESNCATGDPVVVVETPGPVGGRYEFRIDVFEFAPVRRLVGRNGGPGRLPAHRAAPVHAFLTKAVFGPPNSRDRIVRLSIDSRSQ